MLIYYFLNLWVLSTRIHNKKKKEEEEEKFNWRHGKIQHKKNSQNHFRDLRCPPLATLASQLLLSPGENGESEMQAVFVPASAPCFYFCFTPSRIMKVDWLLGFPFSLPLSFPFAVSHAFLAQTCCVWALICQAAINSKKNLFLLNYFQNVMQTCLNYVAANSILRSGFDFMLIQIGKKERKKQKPKMLRCHLSFLRGFLFFF